MKNFFRICAGMLLLATAASADSTDSPEVDFSGFKALAIERSGSFELDMPPDKALPLFTAPGEELWIPTWDPVILSGDGYQAGTTFVTTNHGTTTYWLVTDYNPEAKHAQYVRVTPGANTGTVDVSIAANENGGSTISVTYRLTGLSEAGNAKLEKSYGASSYAAMMEEWRVMIIASRETIEAAANFSS